jgi:predicted dehydrogenase
MKIYNWGIIGPGKIATKFASDLAHLSNAKLHAVASRSKSRADDFAEKFQISHVFESYESMVKDCPDLDIVYVATPHVGHFEATKLCLEHKIAVLCEKPLGMNAREVSDLMVLAEQNQTFFMEAFWTRFLPTTLTYLDLIEKGTIGKIKAVQADFGFFTTFDEDSRLFNKDLGGGSLLDVGIYPIFLTYLLLGKPKNIVAKAVFTKTGIDETTTAIFSYENGEIANILSSCLNKTPTEAMIYGEKGMIHVHGRFHEPTRGFTLKVYDESEKYYPFDWFSSGYHYEAEEVMKCLSAKKLQSDLWSWKNSFDLISILDDVRAEIGLEY